MTRRKVVILYGGRSVEHDVSLRSAANIFDRIDKEKFDVALIGITREGQWFLTASVTPRIEDGEPVSLRLNAQKPEWHTASVSLLPDIIFPVLHGTDGEDGSIQGLIKAMDIPMVGTSVIGSALAMNKIIAKRLLRAAGLPVVDFIEVLRQATPPTFQDVTAQLGLPFMVKAANLGSSVGVSKVKSEADYHAALANAFSFDDSALIERFIKGRELECAILGNYPPQASAPGEIVISPAYEFYTFDAKYVDPHAVEIKVPASLPANITTDIQQLSVRAFTTLQCNDFARVDLFLSIDQQLYINEINTIPGFTNSSMYPMMWQHSGIGFTDLISQLIQFAFVRHHHTKRIQRNYQSALTT
jgi:D-alanine-D-alanine ligase